jgi:hypothetical protein
MSVLEVKLKSKCTNDDFADLYAIIVVDHLGATLFIQDKVDEVVLYAELNVHTLRAIATAAEGEKRRKR